MDYDGTGEKHDGKCMESEIKSVEYSTNCQMCKSIHTGRTAQYSVTQKEVPSLSRSVLKNGSN